jgi:hypothetical protein
MPFAMAPAIDVTSGTIAIGEKDVIAPTNRLNNVLPIPIVLRIDQLSSKYGTGVVEAMSMKSVLLILTKPVSGKVLRYDEC